MNNRFKITSYKDVLLYVDTYVSAYPEYAKEKTKFEALSAKKRFNSFFEMIKEKSFIKKIQNVRKDFDIPVKIGFSRVNWEILEPAVPNLQKNYRKIHQMLSNICKEYDFPVYPWVEMIYQYFLHNDIEYIDLDFNDYSPIMTVDINQVVSGYASNTAPLCKKCKGNKHLKNKIEYEDYLCKKNNQVYRFNRTFIFDDPGLELCKLCQIKIIKREQYIRDFLKDIFEDSMVNLFERYPALVLIDTKISRNELTDFIEKEFMSEIKTIQDTHKKIGGYVGLPRSRPKQKRHDFIYENRGIKPKKKLIELVYQEFGENIGLSEVNKTILDEGKKRKEVGTT